VKTLDMIGAAAFLHIHTTTLQRLASSGAIPCAKPGKCWVFIDDDLAAWLRSKSKAEIAKVESWDSSTEAASITSRSSVTDEELSALLAPETKRRRRNSTIVSLQTYGANRG